ncbi:MAG: hypothetical protein J2P17_33925 [Mycobacterium sp.]|nr:hypothetical protein [Mycobacterium sp.]
MEPTNATVPLGLLVLAVVCLGLATGMASANPPTITRSGLVVSDYIETSRGFDVAVPTSVSPSPMEIPGDGWDCGPSPAVAGAIADRVAAAQG